MPKKVLSILGAIYSLVAVHTMSLRLCKHALL